MCYWLYSFIIFMCYFTSHHIHYNVLLTWLTNSFTIARLTATCSIYTCIAQMRRKLNIQLTHVVVCFCQADTHQWKRYICMFVSMYYCFSIFRLTDLFVIFSLQNLFRFGNKNVDQGHWLLTFQLELKFRLY